MNSHLRNRQTSEGADSPTTPKGCQNKDRKYAVEWIEPSEKSILQDWQISPLPKQVLQRSLDIDIEEEVPKWGDETRISLMGPESAIKHGSPSFAESPRLRRFCVPDETPRFSRRRDIQSLGLNPPPLSWGR